MVSRFRQKLPALSLAVALFALGFPQVAKSLLHLYAESGPAPASSPEGQVLAAMPTDVAALEAADRWLDDPQARIRAGISRFYAAIAEDSVVTPDRAELRRAADDIRDGLARAPANALAWTMLGHASLALGNEAEARTAWQTSIRFAPYDPAIAMARLDLACRIWPMLDESDRELLQQQVASNWKDHPEELIRFSRKRGCQRIVMGSLALDPAKLAAFLALSARLP